MRYVNPLSLESGTRPEQLPCVGIVALAPLVMLVWFAYWLGLIFQVCCLPPLSDTHHSSHTNTHDTRHGSGLAVHAPVAPLDHGSCPQLKSAELVTAPEAPMESTPRPVLIALLSIVVPDSIFSITSSHPLYRQSHPLRIAICAIDNY